MYKILYLTQFPQIGGGETILLSLLKKLDRTSLEPILIIPQTGELSKQLAKNQIKHYILNLPPYTVRTFFVPGTSPTAIYRLIKLGKRISPDLIHINHLTQAVYGGLLGKLLKIPVVATAHGPWDTVYFYQDLITNLLVDKILANTPPTARALLARKIISPDKIQVIPFGIDTASFKPATRYQVLATRKALGLPKESFVITIVGRLDPVKDHLTYFKAAAIIEKKIKNAHFFIVGSKLGDFSGSPPVGEAEQKNSYQYQIKDFLKKKPRLAQKVTFSGFVQDMPQVYHATDVLVSTSISESFGLSILEAAASGLPIVATFSGNLQSIVKNNLNGFLVPPKNPEMIAEQVFRLFRKQSQRKVSRCAARAYVQKEFPLEKYVKTVEALYLNLINHSFA